MSSHRVYWVDIPKFILYGYNPPQPQCYHTRRLKITEHRVVERYLTYLHSDITYLDLFQWMKEIHKVITYLFTKKNINTNEEIDIIVKN